MHADAVTRCGPSPVRHLALEEWEAAETHLREYLWDHKSDAFSFGSTFAQKSNMHS